MLKRIKDVCKGDYVLTHKNQYEEVIGGLYCPDFAERVRDENAPEMTAITAEKYY